MLLIYPPSARSCEAPIGIARLASILRKNGEEVASLDLCREGLDYLLGLEVEAEDTWSRRAIGNRWKNLERLGEEKTFRNVPKYRNSVFDLNRALKCLSSPSRVEASLCDYRDLELSPLRRQDLLQSARDFESNVFFPLFSRRIEESLASLPTNTVGISLIYLSQALVGFAIAGYLRAVHPEIRLITGGGLLTSWIRQGSLAREEAWNGLFDAILPGPAEQGFADFLGFPREPPPLPDYSDFAGLSYLAPRKILPFNFSTGCPWKRCSFCPERAEDSPYSGLHRNAAIGQITTLYESFGPGLIHFTDNEIAPIYLRAIAEGARIPPWYGFARFSPLLADASFCRRLADSGCVMLQLGLESGDQRVLDALGKGTKLEHIDRVLENLRDAGIGTYIYVLFGTPAENQDAALRTRDFVASHESSIDFLNVAIFNLPFASEESKRLRTKPFYEGELSLYRDFDHPAGWNRDEVRRFVARDFESEPSIRKIIQRNPPIFSSSHAPFFL